MFCRIYLTGKSINRKALLDAVSNLLEANLVDGSYIEKNGYSIEVRQNDEYSEEKEKAFPDGFLYFPLSIEIDIEDNVSKIMAAEEVSRILKFLWGNKYSAIASCDFEDILPEKGGYKSRNIPWPG